MFYLRSVAPQSVPTNAICKGVVPLTGLQLVTLAAALAFPSVATWLPLAIGW